MTQPPIQQDASKVMKSKDNKASTLGFVEVSEIRDSVLILREGQMRAVIAASSANFALKSAQEQEIIMGTFQGVLNSLEFPIQILIQSRKLDLSSYIDKLKQIEDTQTNDLLIIKQKQEDFIRNRKLLMSRADSLSSKLAGLDLQVDLLNTEQLIALMYNSYNPDLLESIRLKDVGNIDISL
jgi:hypothetical protein